MAIGSALDAELDAIRARLDVLESVAIPGTTQSPAPGLITPGPVVLPTVSPLDALFIELAKAGPRYPVGPSEGGHKAVNGEDLTGRSFTTLTIPAGATVTGSDFAVTGGGRYALNVQSGGALAADFFSVTAGTAKKAILVSGDLSATYLRTSGGEDGIHQNGGTLSLDHCVIADLDYPPGSHSDCFQQSSGGPGGVAVIRRSALICGFRQQNAPVQLNIGQGCTIQECYLSGGNYAVNGKSSTYKGSVDISDNWFAWGTQQYGIAAVFGTTGSKWAAAERMPRTITPFAYDPSAVPTPVPAEGTPI